MKKCYIAGKIGDLPEAEYKLNFEQAKEEVLKLGFFPVSPVDLPHNHDRSWGCYMREDLTEMLRCQAIFALSNWKNSRGAKIEVNLAKKIGLEIIEQGTSETNRRIIKASLPLSVSTQS